MKGKSCLTNLMTFYNTEVQQREVLPLWMSKPRYQHILEPVGWKTATEKDLGVTCLTKNLSTHQQLTCTAKTAADILGCIRKNSSSSWRKVILSPWLSTGRVKAHLECWVQVWASQAQNRHGHSRVTPAKDHNKKGTGKNVIWWHTERVGSV